MTIRVEHGDCREIIPTLGLTVDAVVTDPPYNTAVMAIGERVKAGAPVPEFMLSRKVAP